MRGRDHAADMLLVQKKKFDMPIGPPPGVKRRVLEVDVCQLSWEVSQPKLAFDDLYREWCWALADRARRELPSEGSNVSGGGR